jgi:hypothetical protein
VTVPAAKARLYAAALRRYLLRLDAAGIPTLVVDPIPRMTVLHGDADACAVILVLADACSGRIERSDATLALGGARAADRVAARGIAHAFTTDFMDDLCDARSCAGNAHGRNLYRDTSHLSVSGALTLTDRFSALILAYARGAHRATPRFETVSG